MRPRRCVWCRQGQDVCPEGDHADLGRRPFWAWRLYYRSRLREVKVDKTGDDDDRCA